MSLDGFPHDGASFRGKAMIAEVGVLVVGAGPTGRLLAAELQRRGVDTLLIFAL